MRKLINLGSVDDIKCVLKFEAHRYTIVQLQQEIQDEQKGQNRKTVINILQSVIKKKQKNN